jgi:hypothetical protein
VDKVTDSYGRILGFLDRVIGRYILSSWCYSPSEQDAEAVLLAYDVPCSGSQQICEEKLSLFYSHFALRKSVLSECFCAIFSFR